MRLVVNTIQIVVIQILYMHCVFWPLDGGGTPEIVSGPQEEQQNYISKHFYAWPYLDGSIAAWGLSFTSTNRPLYRTQSLPKLLFILSQSESSCLGNRMDHLYCIATGNLFWKTVLRCTFALFSFDKAVATSKLFFHASPVSVYALTCMCTWTLGWLDHMHEFTSLSYSMCLPKHMSVHKYCNICMPWVYLRTIRTSINMLNCRLHQCRFNWFIGPGHTLCQCNFQKQPNKWVCI